MKPLGAFLSEHKGFMNRIDSARRQFEQHPIVKGLNEKYPGHDLIPGDIQQYIAERGHCASCAGLEACSNMMAGHRFEIGEDEGKPRFVLNPCDKYKEWRRRQMIKRHVNSHHVPAYILETTFSGLDMDSARKGAIAASMRFCATFQRGETTKGVYLHGSLGVGKSAIAGAIANELAKRGVDVVIIYLPKFFAEMKEAIGSNTVQEKLRVFEEVSVLILDDIGAETLTPWTRDEILMQILNSRMNQLPTVYTSNLSIEELEQHLASTRDGYDEIKAARIIERIEPFVDVHTVQGRNRRRENV